MCVLGRHDDGGLGTVGGLLMHGRGEGGVMTMRAGSYVCLEQEGYEYYCFGRLRALGH